MPASHKIIWRCISGVLFSPSILNAQFNLPLPRPLAAEVIFREDMRVLFKDRVFEALASTSRKDSLRAEGTLIDRAMEARELATASLTTTSKKTTLDSLVKVFCAERFPDNGGQCVVALAPKSIIDGFPKDGGQLPLGTTLVPRGGTSRPYVAEYMRSSGAADGLSVLSQFSANVGTDEAYLVTSLVRGLVGRTIFSADQTIVVARSGDPDPEKREAIENDRANVLRAINNGGTLVGRFTYPIYARSGGTLGSALGVSLGAGIIGPVAGDASRRTGVANANAEYVMAIPIRDLAGTSTIVADLVIGLRGGYTRSGRTLLQDGKHKDVSFGQLMVGLRQSGSLSVSALLTLANNRMSDVVPRLAVNFAAHR